MTPAGPSGANEEFWRDFLTRGGWMEHRLRAILKVVPSDPRCRMCAAPFAGIGGTLMRAVGKRQSVQVPQWCTTCFDFMEKHHGGAEVPISLMFADIRGSTALAERMTPTEFRTLLDRFYDTAADVVFAHDGGVDKFVGDEVVAFFFPLLAGPRHTARAVQAAQALLLATGHGEESGPWAPVGVGVHTGQAWVGTVGEGVHTTLTAVGDNVNVTARLASAAGAGEILVSREAARAAGLDPGLPTRVLHLKGKEQATEVVALTTPATARAKSA